MTAMRFITDEASLQEHVGGAPKQRSVRKQLPYLDEHAQRFLEAAPFCVLATAGADGRCDATPRGDDPGFARVLDGHTLALPERPGNRRLDSLRNILGNPHVGLVFMVPGITHTLRVNGTARLVADADFLDDMAVFGKRPVLALLVSVEECYFHCAKAFIRSRLWQPDAWPGRDAVPSLGRALRDICELSDVEAASIDVLPERAGTF
jgi:PPOX class probable FMN-dependent enzyme